MLVAWVLHRGWYLGSVPPSLAGYETRRLAARRRDLETHLLFWLGRWLEAARNRRAAARPERSPNKQEQYPEIASEAGRP